MNQILEAAPTVNLSTGASFDPWEGFSGSRGHRPPGWEKKIANMIGIIENHKGWSHFKWENKVREAMTTSDFPVLFGDVVDREMLARYQNTPRQMRQMGRIKSLPDFNTVRRTQADGEIARLQEIEPLGEYKFGKIDVRHFTYALQKYGRLVAFSWEAWLRDDVGLFSEVANTLAMSASNTEEFLLTSLFMDSAGPEDNYFADSDFGQGAVDNIPLTRDNLETAIQEMMGANSAQNFRNTEGEPILNVPKFLMVPPVLQLTAEDILDSSPMIAAGDTDLRITSRNMLANRGIQLIVNPWIPVIVTAGSIATTMWMLFSETIKPFEMGLLRGRENPEIFLKSSNAISLSGADSGAFAGSFEADDITYKIRMIQGQTTLNQLGGWASDGQ